MNPFLFSRRSPGAVLALLAALASGCTSIQQSVSMPADVGARGLVLKRGFPGKLPSEAAPVAGSQLVLVPSESAAGLLVPIPFVTEMATGAYHRYEASGLARHLGALDVFGIFERTMAGSPLFGQADGKVPVYPVAYLSDCTDGQYRISLAIRIEQEPWIGRYVAHLPITYSAAELAAAAPGTIAAMRHDVEEGAARLRELVERDAAGALQTARYRADVGSLHLACARVAGMLSANLLLARNAEVLEEDAAHVVIRVPGNLGETGPSGGLMYGVHYLRRDMLHTFDRKPR